MKTIRSLISIFLILALLSGCGADQPAITTAAPETTAATEPSGVGQYTYRMSVSDAAANYSPHDWYSDTDRLVLELTSMGLYAPAISGGTYALQPEMAAGEPVDVTKQYAGTWGIGDDALTGLAWRIDLNPDACWEDGTPINADTYLYSMEQLLRSDAKHYRASRFFSDRLSIASARDYYMQDQAGQTLYRSLADAGYSSAAEAINDGVTTLYLDMTGFWGLDCGWQRVDSRTLYRDESVAEGQEEDRVSANYLYETYLADGAPYSAYQTTFIGLAETTVATTRWQDVGLLKNGEYQITLVLDKPITAAELKWELCTGFLVKEDLYSFGYGTNPAQYASCGPYRLVSATGEALRFQRNETWYGYSDGRHQGQYQATTVSCLILSPQDALAAFEAGQLDTVAVDGGGDAFVIPQTYTSKLTFNTSLAALQSRETPGINKTILSYRDFRQAISLALDRQAFVESCIPTEVPALGLLNETFLADLSTGQRYRETEAGQAALARLYETDDLSSLTGYDPEKARSLLQSAYDAAAADGRIQDGDVVELEFLTYGDGATYQNIVSFLQNALDQAAAGTSLEGRIRVKMTADEAYYDTARAGFFEIILSTWGGSAADPYSILSCYCDREKVFEYGFDPSREICTVTLEDTPISKTYRGWYELLVNGRYAGAGTPVRTEILAQMEYALLSQYACVPVYERNLLFRDASRLTRPVDTALPLVDFGGVRYAGFTCDDASL